ncbi:MAG: site-2 protease family protein [Actinobacteria bacterium]|nr:site-2 protease family protein [Actinomycetota bacterium]
METVLLYILGILIIVVGLALSIGLHELGHLIPAKRFGVRVGQYMIGFGPTIFSRIKGETEYGLKAIPLGGYISMSGMYAPAHEGGRGRTATTSMFETLVQDDTKADDDEGRTFFQLPVFKRVIIMLGGPVMNLLIAVVLYTVILCGFGIAQTTTTIGSVSQCVVAASSQSQECTSSDPVAPGVEAGIKPGDRIVSMNGQAIGTWDEATAIIRASAGKSIDIVVDRAGAEVALTATPLLTERYVYDDKGAPVKGADGKQITEEVGFLGIGSAMAIVQQPVTAVLPTIGDRVVGIFAVITQLPQRLVDVAVAAFGPGDRDPNGLIGVVGVGRLAGEITSMSDIPIASRAAGIIEVVASLNIALFVFNLIPLVPLDGGHIAIALIDGIRRFFAKIFKRPEPGPIDATRILPVTLVVTVLLGAMTLLLVYADIVKPITLQ